MAPLPVSELCDPSQPWLEEPDPEVAVEPLPPPFALPLSAFAAGWPATAGEAPTRDNAAATSAAASADET